MLHHLKDSSDAIVYNLIRWADVQTLLPSSSSWSSWSSWSSPSSRCCGVPIMLITPRSGSSKPIRRSPTLSLQTHGSFPPALTSESICSHSCRFRHSFQPFCWVQPFIRSFSLRSARVLLPNIVFFVFFRTTLSSSSSSSSSAQRAVVEGQADHVLLLFVSPAHCRWRPGIPRPSGGRCTHAWSPRSPHTTGAPGCLTRLWEGERERAISLLFHSTCMLVTAHPYCCLPLLLRFWPSYWLLNHPNIQ